MPLAGKRLRDELMAWRWLGVCPVGWRMGGGGYAGLQLIISSARYSFQSGPQSAAVRGQTAAFDHIKCPRRRGGFAAPSHLMEATRPRPFSAAAATHTSRLASDSSLSIASQQATRSKRPASGPSSSQSASQLRATSATSSVYASSCGNSKQHALRRVVRQLAVEDDH